jgi:hypothetical protein
MTAAQMLKHNTIPLELALKNPKPARGFTAKLFSPLIKAAVIGHKPFKKNGYTPKEFKVETPEEFDLQKGRLIELIKSFSPEKVSDKNLPFFGPLSDIEWGESPFKHIDHHLTQFGV